MRVCCAGVSSATVDLTDDNVRARIPEQRAADHSGLRAFGDQQKPAAQRVIRIYKPCRDDGSFRVRGRVERLVTVTVGLAVRMHDLQLHRLVWCEATTGDNRRFTGLVISL